MPKSWKSVNAIDELKIDVATATANDPESRYGIRSDIVTCLHLAHQPLPAEVKAMFHAKLEYQDLASLKDQILDRAQAVLDDLEGSHASVSRMSQRTQQPRQQHNRGSYNRDTYGRSTHQSPNQRAEAAIRRANTPSPIRTPSNPDNHCGICTRDPQRRHSASYHFTRQCPTLP